MQRNFPGYTCIDEYCNGNNCEFKYIEEPLCDDIGCEDQIEGRCMTIEECKRM